MNHKLFVIGGCKCGKSSHALHLAEAMGVSRKIFVATCQPRDEEMNIRVANHQAERDGDWTTVEAPLDLVTAIEENASPERVVLVDCLAMWITNRLLAGEGEKEIMEQTAGLCQAMKQASGAVILVSNEVGAGIVPENALARKFRDIAGKVNQNMAAACDTVHWVVAGIPVAIKEKGVTP